MLQQQRFAFIGSGAMGEAMIKGLITQAALPPQQITASDTRPERGAELVQKYGVRQTTDNLIAVDGATIVVLSVKPQVLHDVLKQLAGHIASDALVLSIVAGARTEVITNLLQHAAVARSMPNTPAQIGLGMTVWTCPEAMSQLHRDQAKAVFSSIGEEVFVNDERYLDMATALSGTGPAYVFLFMEAMVDAGVHMGFSRVIAEQLSVSDRARQRGICAAGWAALGDAAQSSDLAGRDERGSAVSDRKGRPADGDVPIDLGGLSKVAQAGPRRRRRLKQLTMINEE